MKYGLKLFRDLTEDIHRTYGYLFFPEETACLPLLELSRSYDLPENIVNMAAVKNAVFQNHPEYMIWYNKNELTGLNDRSGMLYQLLGVEVELSGREENLISLFPEAGTDYFIL